MEERPHNLHIHQEGRHRRRPTYNPAVVRYALLRVELKRSGTAVGNISQMTVHTPFHIYCSVQP